MSKEEIVVSLFQMHMAAKIYFKMWGKKMTKKLGLFKNATVVIFS